MSMRYAPMRRCTCPCHGIASLRRWRHDSHPYIQPSERERTADGPQADTRIPRGRVRVIARGCRIPVRYARFASAGRCGLIAGFFTGHPPATATTWSNWRPDHDAASILRLRQSNRGKGSGVETRSNHRSIPLCGAAWQWPAMSGACHTMSHGMRLQGSAMRATIIAAGKIPTPKPLPKPPKLKAGFRLEACHLGRGLSAGSLFRWEPTSAASGICDRALLRAWRWSIRSESGELGVTEHGANEDIRQNWLSHAHGFRLRLRPNARISNAQAMRSCWRRRSRWIGRNRRTRSRSTPNFAGLETAYQAAYGTAGDKDTAKRAAGGTGACGMTDRNHRHRGRTWFRPPSIRPANLSGHRRRRTRFGDTALIGATSQHGATRTRCARCPRCRRWSRLTSRNVQAV